MIPETRSRASFRQAPIEEINAYFESRIAKIIQDNPQIRMYRLFQAMTNEMSQRIPNETQQAAFQALASPDSNTQTIGKKVFLFLNARQLLSAVDYFSLTDDPDEKEDLLQEAISVTLEKISEPKEDNMTNVISTVRAGLLNYTAQKYDIPRSLIATPAFKVLLATIEEVLGYGTRRLSTNEVKGLASELSKEGGVPESNLKDYIMYRIHRIATSTVNEPEEEAETTDLKERIENVTSSLTQRERRVLVLRFGLEGGKEETLEQTGTEFDLSHERIRQIELKALRKLRHPSRSNQLRDYADERWGSRGYLQALLNGVSNALYQKDYGRAINNLTEIESIICRYLPSPEKEIIASLKGFQSSYKLDPQVIDDFISRHTNGKYLNAQELVRVKDYVNETVNKLRVVWKIRSQIPA